MLATARAAQTEEEMLRARQELEAELRPYRSKMSAGQLALLEKQTALLHRYHPKAQMWVSPQSFNREWMDQFLAYLPRQQPATKPDICGGTVSTWRSSYIPPP